MRQTIDPSQNGPDSLLHEGPASGCDPSLELVVKELHHRILNVLSVVQCFVNGTQAKTADDYRIVLSERIAALSDACGLIESTRRNGTSIQRLLEGTLKPHAAFSRDRILLAGPDIVLEPRLALSLHVIFYELATNACKHGSLGKPCGAVDVLWDVLPEAGQQVLAIQWREHGGPRVRPPTQRGFGLRLISSVLAETKVEIDFDPAGVVCRLLIGIDPSCAQRTMGL